MSFKPFLNQNFSLIKSECLKIGSLFEDDKFPAKKSSIFRFKNMLQDTIEWKRPYEIVKNPEFIVNQIEPNDLDQGQLGNCWVIASSATLLSVPEYINRVIPLDQTFEKNNYAGIFHFRFWLNGEWVDVCVDDRLPVDKYGNLLFCHNNLDRNEMFGPLLEKAYAKLNICYEFLIGGLSKDALIDFTGGVNETFNLKRSAPYAEKDRFIDPNKLWKIIFESFSLKSLMSCSANVNENQNIEDRQDNGIIVGHAYSIIALYEILSTNGKFNRLRSPNEQINSTNVKTIRLLKIRNPWGQKVSYKGPWSSDREEWNLIEENVKLILNPNNQTDGQFFMSFEDYIENFDSMDTVHVDLNGILNHDSNERIKWKLIQYADAWIPGLNSGGSGSDPELYWTNPQCEIDLQTVKSKANIAVIVSLLQTESALRRAQTDGKFESSYEAIGFHVYAVRPGSVKQNDKYGPYDLQQVNRLKIFRYEREVSKRIELLPGFNYIVIPCLFQVNKSMKFLLRIFYESDEFNTKTFIKSEHPSKNKKSSICNLI